MQKIKNILTGDDSTSSSHGHGTSSSPRSSLGHDTRVNVDTPGSNSAGTNTAAYDTGSNVPAGEQSHMSKNWALGAIGGSDKTGSGHHNTSTGTEYTSNTGGHSSGLTGNGSNVHSGSTGYGSNIGRDSSNVSGSGLGNAATAAGSNRNASGYDGQSGQGLTSGLTGDRHQSEGEGLTGDRHRGEGLTGDSTHRSSTGSGVGGAIASKLTGNHTIGHDSRDTSKFDPAGANTTHDHKHLQHVTHRAERTTEVEEVERLRNVDRHVHHLQHHVQPVHDQIVKDEVHHNQVVPTTNISEKHVNTDEDVKLFHSLGTKHRDTETHLPKERTVVDLGEKVNTTTHHHVHHVTQPVIEQEVHNRHRIHTQIPLTHTVHEAPIIHKSSVHEPVHMSDFLKGGGKLDSGIRHQEAGVLSTGDCDRQVDGLGEKLVSDLNLKPSTYGSTGTNTTSSNYGSNSASSPTTGRSSGNIA